MWRIPAFAGMFEMHIYFAQLVSLLALAWG